MEMIHVEGVYDYLMYVGEWSLFIGALQSKTINKNHWFAARKGEQLLSVLKYQKRL